MYACVGSYAFICRCMCLNMHDYSPRDMVQALSWLPSTAWPERQILERGLARRCGFGFKLRVRFRFKPRKVFTTDPTFFQMTQPHRRYGLKVVDTVSGMLAVL